MQTDGQTLQTAVYAIRYGRGQLNSRAYRFVGND